MNFMRKALLHIVLFLILFTPSVANAFGGEVTSPFSDGRFHPVLGVTRRHEGADIGIPSGTAVPSMLTGRVRAILWDDGGYGNYIIIDGDNGDSTLYAHGSGYPEGIYVGARVTEGQIVFISGNTGIGTGPHLHAEYHPGGYRSPVNPVPYMIAHGWDLSGDLSGNMSVGGVWGLPKFELDFDYTSYFAPSVPLNNIGKTLLELVTKIGQLLIDNILSLLVLLMIIDLAWYGLNGMIFAKTLSAEVLIPKLIRYGFFLMVCKSWDVFIKTIYVPTFEKIATLYSGQTFTQSTFLEFDSLYTGVSNAIGGYLSLKIAGWEVFTKFLPFLMQNLCVIVILICCIAVSIIMISKIIKFYILMGMSILGLPLSFMPTMEWNGKAMLGCILANILDLVITAFLVGFMILEIKSEGKIPSDNTAALMLFTIKICLSTYFSLKKSNDFSKLFRGFSIG